MNSQNTPDLSMLNGTLADSLNDPHSLTDSSAKSPACEQSLPSMIFLLLNENHLTFLGHLMLSATAFLLGRFYMRFLERKNYCFRFRDGHRGSFPILCIMLPLAFLVNTPSVCVLLKFIPVPKVHAFSFSFYRSMTAISLQLVLHISVYLESFISAILKWKAEAESTCSTPNATTPAPTLNATTPNFFYTLVRDCTYIGILGFVLTGSLHLLLIALFISTLISAAYDSANIVSSRHESVSIVPYISSAEAPSRYCTPANNALSQYAAFSECRPFGIPRHHLRNINFNYMGCLTIFTMLFLGYLYCYESTAEGLILTFCIAIAAVKLLISTIRLLTYAKAAKNDKSSEDVLKTILSMLFS